MRLIFAGSGEFGLPSLEAILGAGHSIVQVVTQPDRPAGRGRHLTPTPIAAMAALKGLPLLKTDNIDNETLPLADLMLVIAFGQKIGEAKVHQPRLGSINLHGSRLPKFRGAGPINAAILAGETTSGNSVIRVAPRMDSGAILGMTRLEIGETETASELHDRLSKDGAPLLLNVIAQLESGTAAETVQDESQATKAPKLSRNAARIDWSAPATDIARKIRGMYAWPGCHVRLVDPTGAEHARVTLVRAKSAEESGPVGTILPSGTIAAGTGAVEIIELQPEGKRPMALAAFKNGHPWNAGMRVQS